MAHPGLAWHLDLAGWKTAQQIGISMELDAMTDIQACRELVQVLAGELAMKHLRGEDSALMELALERAHEEYAQACAVKKLGAVGLTLFKQAA